MGRAPECPGLVGPYALVSGPPMSRRSLRPQLNQIRGWVRQGRTDAWIAHQLEVTVQQIQAFKREQGLEPAAEDVPPVEDVDLRAEDDALIAAELEQEAARKAEEEARAAEEAERKRAEEEAAAEAAAGGGAREGGARRCPPRRPPQPPPQPPPPPPRTRTSPRKTATGPSAPRA